MWSTLILFLVAFLFAFSAILADGECSPNSFPKLKRAMQKLGIREKSSMLNNCIRALNSIDVPGLDYANALWENAYLYRTTSPYEHSVTADKVDDIFAKFYDAIIDSEITRIYEYLESSSDSIPNSKTFIIHRLHVKNRNDDFHKYKMKEMSIQNWIYFFIISESSAIISSSLDHLAYAKLDGFSQFNSDALVQYIPNNNVDSLYDRLRDFIGSGWYESALKGIEFVPINIQSLSLLARVVEKKREWFTKLYFGINWDFIAMAIEENNLVAEAMVLKYPQEINLSLDELQLRWKSFGGLNVNQIHYFEMINKSAKQYFNVKQQLYGSRIIGLFYNAPLYGLKYLSLLYKYRYSYYLETQNRKDQARPSYLQILRDYINQAIHLDECMEYLRYYGGGYLDENIYRYDAVAMEIYGMLKSKISETYKIDTFEDFKDFNYNQFVASYKERSNPVELREMHRQNEISRNERIRNEIRRKDDVIEVLNQRQSCEPKPNTNIYKRILRKLQNSKYGKHGAGIRLAKKLKELLKGKVDYPDHEQPPETGVFKKPDCETSEQLWKDAHDPDKSAKVYDHGIIEDDMQEILQQIAQLEAMEQKQSASEDRDRNDHSSRILDTLRLNLNSRFERLSNMLERTIDMADNLRSGYYNSFRYINSILGL